MTNQPNQPRAELPSMESPPENAPLHAWTEAEAGLAAARTYWLSTVRPEGRPHVMPVWGVWLNGALYFSTGAASRKARNLATNSSCVVSVSRHALDIVVEGEAVRVADEAELQPMAEAYSAKYGWPMTVREGEMVSEDGEGGPVFRVTPSTAFAFGEQEGFTATRWRF